LGGIASVNGATWAMRIVGSSTCTQNPLRLITSEMTNQPCIFGEAENLIAGGRAIVKRYAMVKLCSFDH
jgi:hypothetical protein